MTIAKIWLIDVANEFPPPVYIVSQVIFGELFCLIGVIIKAPIIFDV